MKTKKVSEEAIERVVFRSRSDASDRALFDLWNCSDISSEAYGKILCGRAVDKIWEAVGLIATAAHTPMINRGITNAEGEKLSEITNFAAKFFIKIRDLVGEDSVIHESNRKRDEQIKTLREARVREL